MTDSTGPATKRQLQRDLDELIQRAFANGVEVDNGGYSLRHDDPEIPDWEVLITRTLKSDGTQATDHD